MQCETDLQVFTVENWACQACHFLPWLCGLAAAEGGFRSSLVSWRATVVCPCQRTFAGATATWSKKKMQGTKKRMAASTRIPAQAAGTSTGSTKWPGAKSPCIQNGGGCELCVFCFSSAWFARAFLFVLFCSASFQLEVGLPQQAAALLPLRRLLGGGARGPHDPLTL